MGDHALCGDGNLTRTSGAKCGGNLIATPGFQQGDYITKAAAFDEPETGGSHVDGALRVIERIGFIRAPESQLVRERHGIFAVGKLMQNPCPIRLRMAVLQRQLTRRWSRSEVHGVHCACVKLEVIGSPDGIIGIFDRDFVGRIVLAIQETGDAKDTVAVGASRIGAEGKGEQLERLFLTRKVKAFDAPKHLIFAGRSRQNRGRRRYGNRCPECSESGIAIGIYIEIEMPDRCDAFLSTFAAARAKRIGGGIDVRADAVLIGEPRLIARGKCGFECDDALRRNGRTLSAKQESNGLFRCEATVEELVGD